jgi:hypothetical protein
MKKVVVLAGALLIVVAVVYGFTGVLVPSIQERGDHIARWEREIAKDKQDLAIAISEADRLGKQPASTSDRESPFEAKLAEVERRNQHLRSAADRIDHERVRRKEMSLITAAFAGAGVLAILFGLRMRSRA